MLKLFLSNSRRQQFFYLLIFYAAFLWARIFSFSILGPRFLDRNVNLGDMIMGNVMFFGISFIWLLIFKVQSSRGSWLVAAVASLAGLITAINVNNSFLYYLYSALLGVGSITYFIPYNIAHFRLTPGHRNSFSAAIMFSIIPVIAFIAPLVAGWVAQFSYGYIWAGSLASFLLVLGLIRFQHRFSYRFNFMADLNYLRPAWMMLVLEGLWEPVIFGAIPIFALKFVNTPLAFGAFSSYLGLVAIAANLFLGKVSDKLNRRLIFLIPVTILLAVSTLAMPLAINSFIGWVVIGGIINFLAPLFWNFSTAYFVDILPDSVRSMPAREWILSGSRLIGFLLLYLNFIRRPFPALAIYFLGAAMLFYPVVLLYNTRHADRS